ncbi:MAG TPA: 4Fe-4S dicluster domain-containing protein [Chloroflexota bacterium]
MAIEEQVKAKLDSLAARETTRRGFLKLSASAGLSLAAVSAFGGLAAQSGFAAPAMPIMTNSKGMILADPTRCVGCRRCELACTEFNDGKSHPSISRVQVGRNYNFGPEGPRVGMFRGMGEFGNYRLVQDTCKQCPHPVPCATACPQGAIVADPATGARVVDAARCIGCGLCNGACPWQMINVDPDTRKATKCFNCGQCAEACPTGALKFVPWQDHSKDTPPRVAAFKITAQEASDSCAPCHKR